MLKRLSNFDGKTPQLNGNKNVDNLSNVLILFATYRSTQDMTGTYIYYVFATICDQDQDLFACGMREISVKIEVRRYYFWMSKLSISVK